MPNSQPTTYFAQKSPKIVAITDSSMVDRFWQLVEPIAGGGACQAPPPAMGCSLICAVLICWSCLCQACQRRGSSTVGLTSYFSSCSRREMLAKLARRERKKRVGLQADAGQKISRRISPPDHKTGDSFPKGIVTSAYRVWGLNTHVLSVLSAGYMTVTRPLRPLHTRTPSSTVSSEVLRRC